MAGEFGISADEVIALLRQMDVPVRSHLSLLTDDQVARIRARWEREKRARAEKQTAPPPTTRRRRSSATAPVVEVAAPAPAESGIRRRRRSEVVVAPTELPEDEAAIAAEAATLAEPEVEVEAAEEVPVLDHVVAPERPAPVRAEPSQRVEREVAPP